MAQNTEIELPRIRYTRADFTSLRAWLNRIPLRQIQSLYYNEEDLEEMGCETDAKFMARLRDLQDQLITLAAVENPHLEAMMIQARQRGLWSPVLITHLTQNPELIYNPPKRDDRLSLWFKHRLCTALLYEGIVTFADLLSVINVRGSHWWKPIPRIGKGCSVVIESCLKKYEKSIGPIEIDILPTPNNQPKFILQKGHPVAPLDNISLPSDLDGHAGKNRCTKFSLIYAQDDLSAVDTYLIKFKSKPLTLRAYRKELERFLLWCITERGIAMSSVLTEDCEGYKDFLASVPSYWISTKKNRLPRNSHGWRPFAGQLSHESQKYAVSVILFFFNWLVDVRYLGGNPWKTVSLPDTVKKINPMAIEKALPEDVWRHLTEQHGILDTLCGTPDQKLSERYKLRGHAAHMSMSGQFRLLRAVLLLLGDTGMRREELVLATRERLKPILGNRKIWELKVTGKRNKERLVFPSRRSIAALREHWIDRNLESEFDLGMSVRPLISPLVAPYTKTGQAKHVKPTPNNSDGVVIDVAATTELSDAGYSPDGLYRLIKIQLNRIANDPEIDLTEEEREVLRQSATHAFRHTFATHAVSKGVPLDVMQKVLGHASLQTTTIYVQAEKKRSIEELGKFFD